LSWNLTVAEDVSNSRHIVKLALHQCGFDETAEYRLRKWIIDISNLWVPLDSDDETVRSRILERLDHPIGSPRRDQKIRSNPRNRLVMTAVDADALAISQLGKQ
jgi:hypothetical protein